MADTNDRTANLAARPRDGAAMNFIDDCIEQADKVRKPNEEGWKENWSNYRVESTFHSMSPNKTYPFSSSSVSQYHYNLSPVNFLKTTESHQGVNTLRALLLSSLFGVRDYVQADPVGDEDVEAAKRVSKLVMYGLERPGNFRTNYECLGDGLIFGLGSYTGRWKLQNRLVPRRLPVPDPTGSSPDGFLHDPQTGSIMTVLSNQYVPVFDDPILETDDLFDTWFDPSANRFDQLQWKIKRFRMRDEDLMNIMNDPRSQVGGWDIEGIGLVLQTEPSETESLYDRNRGQKPKLITENLTLEDIKNIKEYGYYGGWYFEGTIPDDCAQEIGGLDSRGTCILRVINGHVIQAGQSRQRNGSIEGGVITILPTGQGIYGLAPLTVVRHLQDVGDTQLILTVQAFIESVYQNYLIGGDQGPDFARNLETRRPREVFTLQGEVDQVMPLPKDYTGLNIATGALSAISQTMRNAMNARDPVQGIFKQTGESTATSDTLIYQAATQNTDQLAVLIEREELPQMGRIINDLFYIHLDDEGKVFRRVGETETTSVKYFDIDAVTDITMMGARSLLGKQQKANQFRDFAQLILSNPLTASSIDWNEFVRRYGDECLDVRGLEHLMINDPEEIVHRMMAMGLANVPAQIMRQGTASGQGPSGGAPQPKGRTNTGNGGATGGVPASNAGEPQ